MVDAAYGWAGPGDTGGESETGCSAGDEGGEESIGSRGGDDSGDESWYAYVGEDGGDDMEREREQRLRLPAGWRGNPCHVTAFIVLEVEPLSFVVVHHGQRLAMRPRRSNRFLKLVSNSP